VLADRATATELASVAAGLAEVGLLTTAGDVDWANAALRRMWRLGDRGRIDARAFGRALEPVSDPAPAVDDGRPRRRAPRVTPVSRALRGERVEAGLYRLTRGDGTVGVVRVSAEPIRDASGSVIGAAMTVCDETARHDSARLRDAFIGILGHELRTPIGSILSGSELLRNDGLDTAARREIAGLLVGEADRLDRLVDQLIRLALLERRGPAETEPVHLLHLARSVAARHRQSRSRTRIDVVTVSPANPVALGDEGYVVEALGILIQNAVSHAGRRASVQIRIEPHAAEVAIHVLDDGPGLPAGRKEDLFRLYHRGFRPTTVARGAARRDPGHGRGIGLFVARAIVEAMGGRIWAVDRSNGGADIAFALPVAPD
jgi:signal transduction histidine kinase